MTTSWGVFVKPWPHLDADRLGERVRSIGFDSIELPIRPGFAVTPEAPQELARFARRLADQGIVIGTVAADPTPAILEACHEAAVPMIRIMADIDGSGYRESVAALRTRLFEISPMLEELDLRIGVQPHHGRYVSTAAGLAELLRGLPECITAVWDVAHGGLSGEDEDIAVPQLADRLSLVNLKNAHYERHEGAWRTRFVAGPDGLTAWDAAFDALRAARYTGGFCLSGQYDDLQTPIEEALRKDLAYAQSLHAAALGD